MPDKCKLQINVYDGKRELFSAPQKISVTIIDSYNQQHVSGSYGGNSLIFELPFYNNLRDHYAVTISAKGYKQTGFVPVFTHLDGVTSVDLMLVPKTPEFRFVDASWLEVSKRYPFVGGDVPNAEAERRYEDMMESDGGKIIACMLNLFAAMDQILLGHGTPTTYIKQIAWNRPPQQDRFFAYCDPKLVNLTRQAAKAGFFAEEENCAVFHPGSTHSWKQIKFGEANVQLTFHENDKATVDGLGCIIVEPDIDYYKDLTAHTIFEVIPNTVTRGLTDPVEVYVLRWQAGIQAGIPEFKPLYVIE